MKAKARIGLTVCLLLSTAVFSHAILKKGDPFLPFSLKDVNGKTVTVKLEDSKLTLVVEFEANGKKETVKSFPSLVMLDFWATWCVPCRAAMPYMQKIYEKFQPKEGALEGGLVLLGIALDTEGSRLVKPFFEKIKAKLKITSTMLADPSEIAGSGEIIRTTRDMAKKYKVQEIPVVYVIDAKGRIVHAHMGFKKNEIGALENEIAGLLAGTGSR